MRLIDADALTNHIKDELCFPVECEECTFFQPYDKECILKIWVGNAPTIDAVEVVRCKDCDNYSECEYDLIKSLENGYCSFGERSEE